MREILFRGKPISNEHKWVYGDYCDLNKGRSVSSFKVFAGPFIGTPSTMYAVIPETVRQYTGLTDKNGKKIFEGDILIYVDDGEYGVNEKYLVVFDDDEAAFRVKYYVEGKYMCYDDITPCENFEVIGSIHDNPELLEREHNE